MIPYIYQGNENSGMYTYIHRIHYKTQSIRDTVRMQYSVMFLSQSCIFSYLQKTEIAYCSYYRQDKYKLAV